MRSVAFFALASMSIKEAIRDRIFAILGVFAAGLMLLALVLGRLTVGWPARIVTDVSLTSITAIGTIAGAALTIRFIGGDLQRRTLYVLLARPLRRSTYILARFAGIVISVAVLTAAMWMMSAVAIYLTTRHDGPQITAMETSIYTSLATAQFAIVAAVALLLTTVSSPTIAFVGALSFAVASRSISSLHQLLSASDSPGSRLVGRVLYGLLPDFSAMSPLASIVHDRPAWNSDVSAALAYSGAYLGILLLGCIWLFERKDAA